MSDLALRIANLERRVSDMLIMATVKEVDPIKYMVKCKIGANAGDISAWLPMYTPMASKTAKASMLPQIGEIVTLLSPNGDIKQAKALGFVFYTKGDNKEAITPPEVVEGVKGDIKLSFENDDYIKINTDTGNAEKLNLDVNIRDINLKASQEIKLKTQQADVLEDGNPSPDMLGDITLNSGANVDISTSGEITDPPTTTNNNIKIKALNALNIDANTGLNITANLAPQLLDDAGEPVDPNEIPEPSNINLTATHNIKQTANHKIKLETKKAEDINPTTLSPLEVSNIELLSGANVDITTNGDIETPPTVTKNNINITALNDITNTAINATTTASNDITNTAINNINATALNDISNTAINATTTASNDIVNTASNNIINTAINATTTASNNISNTAINATTTASNNITNTAINATTTASNDINNTATRNINTTANNDINNTATRNINNTASNNIITTATNNVDMIATNNVKLTASNKIKMIASNEFDIRLGLSDFFNYNALTGTLTLNVSAFNVNADSIKFKDRGGTWGDMPTARQGDSVSTTNITSGSRFFRSD